MQPVPVRNNDAASLSIVFSNSIALRQYVECNKCCDCYVFLIWWQCNKQLTSSHRETGKLSSQAEETSKMRLKQKQDLAKGRWMLVQRLGISYARCQRLSLWLKVHGDVRSQSISSALLRNWDVIIMAVGSHSEFFSQETGMTICVFLKDFSEWSVKNVRGR